MFVPSGEVGADGVSVVERPDGTPHEPVAEHEMVAVTDEGGAFDVATTTWVRVLTRRRERFASEGIVYQTLVVPDASVVAGERPGGDEPGVGGASFEQLSAALDEKTLAQCVHPLDELRAGGGRGAPYAATDGSWTDWGAWLGYRASISALAAAVPGVRLLDEADVIWSERFAGDLAGPAHNVSGSRLEPTATVQHPRARLSRTVGAETGDVLLVMEQDGPELPTAVVFRDSLMDSAAKFFSESFRRTVFVTSPNAIFWDLVAAERPDVVIHELAERRLVLAPAEPSTIDFRAVFGDLVLDDSQAVADERRSRSLARAGRFEEALAASNDVLARVLPTARVMVNRARLHLHVGRNEAAVEALRHAVTLDPADGLAWSMLGQLLVGVAGRERQAASAQARAARAEPDQPAYWRLAMTAALRADDLDLADELRAEAVARHPGDPQVSFAASWVLAARGRLEEAEQAAGYAARAMPESVEHLWQLASLQIRRGRVEDAALTVSEIGRISPDDPNMGRYREMLRNAASQTATTGGCDEGQR